MTLFELEALFKLASKTKNFEKFVDTFWSNFSQQTK